MASSASCHLQSLTEVEQRQALDALEPAEKGVSQEPIAGAGCLSILLSSSIFVQNLTGQPLIVYVQRNKMARMLQKCNIAVGIDNIGCGLEAAIYGGRLEAVAVDKDDIRQRCFRTAALKKRAYLTVAVNDGSSDEAEKQLFCRDYEVPVGHCLIVEPGQCFRGRVVQPSQNAAPAQGGP